MTAAVLYRWRLHEGREDEFCDAWAAATRLIHRHCGSYGARLHLADNGEWWSYARWPSEEARARCFENEELRGAPCFEAMRACVAERFDEVRLEIRGDQLAEPDVE